MQLCIHRRQAPKIRLHCADVNASHLFWIREDLICLYDALELSSVSSLSRLKSDHSDPKPAKAGCKSRIWRLQLSEEELTLSGCALVARFR
jgi:hypothetical protein